MYWLILSFLQEWGAVCPEAKNHSCIRSRKIQNGESSTVEESVWHRATYLKFLTAMPRRIYRGWWSSIYSHVPASNGNESIQFDVSFHMNCFLLQWPSFIEALLSREILFFSHSAVLLCYYFTDLKCKVSLNYICVVLLAKWQYYCSKKSMKTNGSLQLN